MAGLSQISGLVANFDVKGAIEELLAPRRAEIDRIEKQVEAIHHKQDLLRQLNDKLLALKHAAESLADGGSFFSYTATLASSSTTPAAQMLEVSGSQNVLPGTHTIVIQQLAQAMRIGSGAAIQTAAGAPAATVSDPLGLAGSFQINGATVTVHASDSAADIARKINDLGVGVQASAIQVATGDVRLVIASTQTGAQGFQIGGVDLDAGGALAGLGLGAPASANAYQVLQQGQDAKVVIDGLTLTRASNTITDAIPGLTLDLKQADPATTITMTIGVDREALRASVQAFVDAYNEVADFLNAQFAFDEAKGTSGPLAGEAALHAIQSELADSLLRELPGLAPDRNSLVKIGIEPDEKGHLRINDSLFAKFLNDAPEAIRDVFVASGSTSAAGLTFLTPAFQPASGSYTVQITQPALRADIVGTADLSAGVSASSTVTITETATGRVARVDLIAGMTLQQVLDALNAEFARSYTEKHQLSQALTAGGAPATASTTFAALGLGVQPGDTIAIQGTDHYGRAIAQTFTIADPNATTLGDLLAAIESAYAHAITASLDASGHIVITDATSGESQLSLQLVAHNEGGGTLAFGTEQVLTAGRNPLDLEAIAAGNGVEIRSRGFGSSAGFSISQTTDVLGIANQTVQGVDVAGTINGFAATGRGRTLTGAAGPVDGMAVFYTGNAPISATMDVRIGAGAALAVRLDQWANPFTGALQTMIAAGDADVQAAQDRIEALKHALEMRRQELVRAFAEMERAMSVLQSTGDYLAAQIKALSGNNNR